MLNHFVEMQNIEITYVDGTNPELVDAAIKKNTKVMYREDLGEIV